MKNCPSVRVLAPCGSMQCCSAAVSSVLPSPRAAHVASQDAVGSVAGSGPGSRGTARAARARLPHSPERPSTTRRARARAGAGAAAARGRASPSRAPAHCDRMLLDRGRGKFPIVFTFAPAGARPPWTRNFTLRLRGSASTPLGALSRIRAHRRLPSRPRNAWGSRNNADLRQEAGRWRVDD